MSVYSFLESAKILQQNERYEEALCLVCIAIDACASNSYTNEKNNEKYKKFLKEHFSIICRHGFPGLEASNIRIKVNIPSTKLRTDNNGYVNMEQIIYHVIRCSLVHECNIDQTIEFTDKTIIGDWNDKFYIPKALICGLIAAVEEEL